MICEEGKKLFSNYKTPSRRVDMVLSANENVQKKNELFWSEQCFKYRLIYYRYVLGFGTSGIDIYQYISQYLAMSPNRYCNLKP